MSQPDNSKLATASSPIRMRVQGMDCAKDAAEIERVLRGLFEWFCAHPEELPAEHPAEATPADRVMDYLAGMTDRFAIRAWTDRAVPTGFAL